MPITRELLLDLFDHMEWADGRLWGALLAHDGARVDGQIRDVLMHLHTVQRAFLNAWTNEAVTFRQRFDDTTLPRELPSVRSYYAPARTFIASLDDRTLGAVTVLPWTKYVEQHLGHAPAEISLGETILHVLLHSTHHRAQVNSRLRAIGAEPPTLDYIAWLWLDRPTSVWPQIESGPPV